MIDMEHINPSSGEVAETLKQAIKDAGLSQRQIAEAYGIPLTTLNRHLNSGGLEWDEIKAIASAVGKSASSLITDTAIRVASTRAAA